MNIFRSPNGPRKDFACGKELIMSLGMLQGSKTTDGVHLNILQHFTKRKFREYHKFGVA